MKSHLVNFINFDIIYFQIKVWLYFQTFKLIYNCFFDFSVLATCGNFVSLMQSFYLKECLVGKLGFGFWK